MGKTVLSEQTALSALLALRENGGWFRPATFTADCGCPTQAQVDFIANHENFSVDKIHVLVAKQEHKRRRCGLRQSVYTGSRNGVVVRADQ